MSNMKTIILRIVKNFYICNSIKIAKYRRYFIGKSFMIALRISIQKKISRNTSGERKTLTNDNSIQPRVNLKPYRIRSNIQVHCIQPFILEEQDARCILMKTKS